MCRKNIYRLVCGRQRAWLPIIFNINEMIKSTARGSAPWREINLLQLFIAEKQYKDKTKLIFDVGTIQLMRFKTPVITKLNSPEIILLPRQEIPLLFELLGNMSSDKKYKVIAELQNSRGKIIRSLSSEINPSRTVLLNSENIKPGNYLLVLMLSVEEKICNRFSKKINFLAGPLFNLNSQNLTVTK
jgi:hypothetical protein